MINMKSEHLSTASSSTLASQPTLPNSTTTIQETFTLSLQTMTLNSEVEGGRLLCIQSHVPYGKVYCTPEQSLHYHLHPPSFSLSSSSSSSSLSSHPLSLSAAVSVALSVCDGVSFLLNMLYGELGQSQRMKEEDPTMSQYDDHPKGNFDNHSSSDDSQEEEEVIIPLALLRGALNTLSPYSILFEQKDDEADKEDDDSNHYYNQSICLASINPHTEVRVELETGTQIQTIGNEILRYQSVDMIQHPEEIDKTTREKNAVYTIGMILYEMMSGSMPYSGYSSHDVVELLCQGIHIDLSLLEASNRSLVSLIQHATSPSHSSRPSLAEFRTSLALLLPRDPSPNTNKKTLKRVAVHKVSTLSSSS